MKYGPSIRETAALLEELVILVKKIDPGIKRISWPPQMLAYLYDMQDGRCALCNKKLPNLGKGGPHVDHVVPWAQGGDNAQTNLRLLHIKCNLAKSDECNPDDVIRYLQSRLLNLRDDQHGPQLH